MTFPKMSMTFPTMFQASNVYKNCKWKHSSAYMEIKVDQLQHRRLCQKFGVKDFQKGPMTFPTMFQASSVAKAKTKAKTTANKLMGFDSNAIDLLNI